MLQKTVPFVQKICSKAAINDMLFEKMKDFQLSKLKLNEPQNPDKNPQQIAYRWRVVDKIVCYGD